MTPVALCRNPRALDAQRPSLVVHVLHLVLSAPGALLSYKRAAGSLECGIASRTDWKRCGADGAARKAGASRKIRTQPRRGGDLPDALNVRGTGALFFNERWVRTTVASFPFAFWLAPAEPFA